jgi:hypothetical protein
MNQVRVNCNSNNDVLLFELMKEWNENSTFKGGAEYMYETNDPPKAR